MPTVAASDLKNYEGQSLGCSDWLEIDQDRVNAFADCTNDHQFIHVDPEAAAKTPFGGPIAHGFLTLSLLSSLGPKDGVVVENIVMGINYGADKTRFLNPVRVGKRIRAHWKLISVTQKSATNFLFKQEVTVEIEGEDKPALICEQLGMQVTAPPA